MMKILPVFQKYILEIQVDNFVDMQRHSMLEHVKMRYSQSISHIGHPRKLQRKALDEVPDPKPEKSINVVTSIEDWLESMENF
jgi:hypothetical protein